MDDRKSHPLRNSVARGLGGRADCPEPVRGISNACITVRERARARHDHGVGHRRCLTLIFVLMLTGCTSPSFNGDTGSAPFGGTGANTAEGGAAAVAGTAPAPGVPSHAGAGASGALPASGGSGSGLVRPASVIPQAPHLSRLSRKQRDNSMKDLLGVDAIDDVLDRISADAVVGFDNEVEALFMTPQLREDLEGAARALAARVVSDRSALERLAPLDADAVVRARNFITRFGYRAYRRPLAESEIAQYQALFDQARTLYPNDPAFEAGVNLVLQAMLQSPHFLYRIEFGSNATDGKVPLTSHEVAAKLAFALTNRMPDPELFTAADAGRLTDSGEVLSQASRLLRTPSGASARDHLHFQILRLGAYDTIVRDSTVFPNFRSTAPDSMRLEMLAFTRHVFDQGQGLREMFTSPLGFVNEDLAPLYGLGAAFGPELTQVTLGPERAGLLTRAGFLASFAIINDPDTIRRGVFINERILCVDLPPPDPNATNLVPLDEQMTNRERVEATTGPGTCGAGCHATVINPPGFAFEHFDAVGSRRDTDRGKPINARSSYQFTEGLLEFDGAAEFAALLADSAQAHHCYAENWMRYLHGREPSAEEQPFVRYLADSSKSGALSIESLVLTLVGDEGFLKRLPP
jgi:hypothetical protein